VNVEGMTFDYYQNLTLVDPNGDDDACKVSGKCITLTSGFGYAVATLDVTLTRAQAIALKARGFDLSDYLYALTGERVIFRKTLISRKRKYRFFSTTHKPWRSLMHLKW